MRSPDELTAKFRDGGLKVTPQRQSIFRILHASEAHPSAEAVHAAASVEMPTISLRTVYQTLNDLADMGELVALDLGTGAVRFDPNLEAHQHLVCEVCGRGGGGGMYIQAFPVRSPQSHPVSIVA
ncbi:MAG: Fur family transcriptional regulator, partial [Acidimicrobiales bacterium]